MDQKRDPTIAIEKYQIYGRACDAAIHFSTCVLNTRTATIVQGVAIITGAIYLSERGFYVLSLIVVSFGVLFTLVLSSLQKNYLNFWFQTVSYAAKLEDGKGPWSACLQDRDNRLGGHKLRILVENGSELLITITLLAVFVYDISRII